MSLKLYNSLSSKKEVFKSISDKKVKTYVAVQQFITILT